MKLYEFGVALFPRIDRMIVLLEKNHILLTKIEGEIKMLATEVQALIDQVTNTDGVEASAVVAIQGYLQQIVDLLAQVTMSPEDRALVTAKTAELAKATNDLAAAIAAPVPPAA